MKKINGKVVKKYMQKYDLVEERFGVFEWEIELEDDLVCSVSFHEWNNYVSLEIEGNRNNYRGLEGLITVLNTIQALENSLEVVF